MYLYKMQSKNKRRLTSLIDKIRFPNFIFIYNTLSAIKSP